MAGVFDIKITGDVRGVVTLPKQIRFAAAKSLNDTGGQSQRDTVEELERGLHVRRSWDKPKTRYGINLISAKFASDNPEAVVYTRADWLLEEEGFNSGVKRPDKGGDHLAVPDTQNIRGSIQNIVPSTRKARKLLANAGGRVSLKTGKLIGKTGAFKLTGKDGRTFVFQRVGTKNGEVKRTKKGTPLRGRVKGGQSKLEFLYVFEKSVKVPRQMIIQKTVMNTFKVYYADYFSRNIRLALRTAR